MVPCPASGENVSPSGLSPTDAPDHRGSYHRLWSSVVEQRYNPSVSHDLRRRTQGTNWNLVPCTLLHDLQRPGTPPAHERKSRRPGQGKAASPPMAYTSKRHHPPNPPSRSCHGNPHL